MAEEYPARRTIGLGQAMKRIQELKEAAHTANDEAEFFQGRVANLERELEGMVLRAELDEVRSQMTGWVMAHGGAVQEFTEARAELQEETEEAKDWVKLERFIGLQRVLETEKLQHEKVLEELADARAELADLGEEGSGYVRRANWDNLKAQYDEVADRDHRVGEELLDARAEIATLKEFTRHCHLVYCALRKFKAALREASDVKASS